MVDSETELPFREAGPIRRMGHNAKCADGRRIEYASALRRFLCSMVDYEWDHAHSSIVKRAKDGVKWAKWALEHLEWTVEFDAVEIDGKVYDTKGNRVESWGKQSFYVCRGILKSLHKDLDMSILKGSFLKKDPIITKLMGLSSRFISKGSRNQKGRDFASLEEPNLMF